MASSIGARVIVLPEDNSPAVVRFKWTVLPTAKIVEARPDFWAAVPIDAGKKVPTKKVGVKALARPKR